MNALTLKDNTKTNADLDAGFRHLRSRFLSKDGRYIDTASRDLTRFKRQDLLGTLRSLAFSDEQVRLADKLLRSQDLRVWSGRDVFAPNQGRIVDDHDLGMSDINTWTAPNLEPIEGDPSPFLDFLAKLIPDPQELEWFLSFIASKYQRPDIKPQHAAVLFGRQGTGKSTIKAILGRVFGSANVNNANTVEALVGPFSAMNWMKLWIVAEELQMTNNGKLYNDIKELITGVEFSGQRKGQDFTTFQTTASLLILSNDEPSFIDTDDRRFFIVETPYPWSGEDDPAKKHYFERLYQWLENENGYAVIAWLFKTHDCTGYSPKVAAPSTKAKEKIVGIAGVGFDQEVADYLADLRREVVTDSELGKRFERVTFERLRHPMGRAGWVRYIPRVTINGKKTRVWLKEGAEIKSEQRKKAILVPVNGVPVELDDINFDTCDEAEDAL